MADKSEFGGTPLTANYKPTVRGWSTQALDHRGWWTPYEVERMERDPRIRFGLRILAAPLSQVTWEVTSDDQEVAAWADRTLRKLWLDLLGKLSAPLCYGWGAGEQLWSIDEATGRVEWERLEEVHPLDARPLVSRTTREVCGITIAGTEGQGSEGGRLSMPRSWWLAIEPRYGSPYGEGRLAGAWYPFQEKVPRHGALDIRRTWHLKNAYHGGMMRHPLGTIDVGGGVFMSCQDYARELMEKLETGGILVLPSTKDEEGNYLWEYVPPQLNGDPGTVGQYLTELDKEILTGMGIPIEVVEAAATGSGWSGRSVPFLVFLAGADAMALAIYSAADRQTLRPGVLANFGPDADYKVVLKSLVPKEPEQPTASGQGNGGPPPAMPVQMGLDRQASLDRRFAHVERVARVALECSTPLDFREIVRNVREAAARLHPRRPVQLGNEGDPVAWEPYVGERGGRGWRNPQTGTVVYQTERPGAEQGGGGKSKPKGTTRERGLDIFEAGKAKLSGFGRSLYGRLPRWGQRVVDFGQAVEHQLQRPYAAGQAMAVAVAQERGLPEDHVERVARVLAWSDGIARWTVNVPAAHHAIHALAHIGGPVAFIGAKAGFYVPVASLAYIGYSVGRAAAGGRNPIKLVRAARARMKAAKAAEAEKANKGGEHAGSH